MCSQISQLCDSSCVTFLVLALIKDNNIINKKRILILRKIQSDLLVWLRSLCKTIDNLKKVNVNINKT